MLSIVKQVRTLICVSAIYFSTNLLAQNTVGPFTYTPGPASGILFGIVTIDGSPAADGDVIAAFDATGNCAGANWLIMNGGVAYIQLPIYGDDIFTEQVCSDPQYYNQPDCEGAGFVWSGDEGMDGGEDFYLKVWDSSSNNIYTHAESFDCWSNQNGSSLDECGTWSTPFDFSVPFNFTLTVNASGDGFNRDLNFGFSGNATDGYDAGIDSYAPPAPPSGFDAALIWDNDRYYTQILQGLSAGAERVLNVQLQYGSDETDTLSWDNTGWSELGSFLLQDAATGGTVVDVDMTIESSVIITNTAVSILNLKVTPNGASEAVANFVWEPNYLEIAFTDMSLTGFLEDGSVVDIASWSWDFDDGNSSTEQNPIHTYAGEGTYEVTLMVTDGNDLTDSYTASVAAVVPVPPIAGFSVTVNILAVTFTDESTPGNSTINAWNWNFGDGGTSDEEDPVHTYAQVGLYTVSLTVSDESGLSSDPYTEDVQAGGQTVGPFTIYPNPLSGIFLGQATVDGVPASEGDIVAAFDTDGNCAGADSVIIQSGIAYISLPIYGDDNTTGEYDEGMGAGDAYFSLKLYSASTWYISSYPTTFGCWYNNNGAPMDECGGVSEVFDFPGTEGPAASFSADSTIGDAPLPVAFTDNSTNGSSDIVSRNWNFDVSGGTGFDTLPNPIYTYANPGLYTVSLTVTDENNLNDIETMENYILVGTAGVNDAPIVTDIELTTYEDTNVNIPFSDYGFDADGDALTFSAGEPSNGIIGPVGVTYDPHDNYYGSDSFTFTATDINGAVSNEGTVTVLIVPVDTDAPVAIASVNGGNSHNEGTEVTLNGFGSYDPDDLEGGGCPGCTYSWTVPDGITLSNPAVGDPTFTAPAVDADTEYTFSLVVSDGTYNSDPDEVTVTVVNVPVPPAAGFSYSAENLIVTFTDTSTAGEGGAISGWSWDLGDGDTSAEQNPVHTYTFGGTYTVSLTVTDTSGVSGTHEENVSVSPLQGTPNFGISLTASGGAAGSEPAYGMTFGFSPAATDGFDVGFDSYAPPAPPPPAFDAALSWEGDRYYTQILAGDDDLSERIYDIALAYPTENLITLTWNNTGWSHLGAIQLQDAFGGLLGIDIDMTDSTSLTLTNSAFNTLKLKVTPAGYSVPIADFTWATDFLNVSFADGSVPVNADIAGWYWDFGDGSSDSTSTDQNPTHTYAESGEYTVTLTATDVNGLSSFQSTQSVIVSTAVGPTANFDYVAFYNEVHFTDLSNGGDGAISSWSWTFGDDGTSTEQNPVHTYAAIDAYTVFLTITNDNGDSDSAEMEIAIGGTEVGSFTIYPNPASGIFLGQATIDGASAGDGDIVAAFDPDGNCAGAAEVIINAGIAYIQLPIYGNDQTTDFDEGMDVGESFTLLIYSDSSGEQYDYTGDPFENWYNNNGAPMDGYNDPYAVYNFSTAVDQPPVADFSAEPTIADYSPLTVQFTDMSTAGSGEITGWIWNFTVDSGIPSGSNDQNPSYIYQSSGVYTVRLTVTDANGLESVITKENYILVGTAGQDDAPLATDINLTILEDEIVLPPYAEYSFDADVGDVLTFFASGPSHGTITGADNMTYIPDPNYYGFDSFTYTATDLSELSGQGTVFVVIVPVDNDPPVANILAEGVFEGNVVETDGVTLNGWNTYDPDDCPDPEAGGCSSFQGSFEWSSADNPQEINLQTSVLGYASFEAPEVAENEDYTFYLNVYDGNTWSDTAFVTITVQNNDAPVLGDIPISPAYSTSIGGFTTNLTATDTETDVLIYIASSNQDSVTVSVDNDTDMLSVGWTADWSGWVNITITVSDSWHSDTETFQVHVLPEEMGVDNPVSIPDVFALRQNYPNPFNPVTTIAYEIPVIADVTIEMYNILGQKVRTLVNGTHQPGVYHIRWNGTNDFGNPLSSGMYFYKISSEKFISVKKLILMK